MLIYVMHEDGFPASASAKCMEGLQEMARHLPQRPDIRSLGVWQAANWKDRQGNLLPYQSMAWYRASAVQPNGQVNASKMLVRLWDEPHRKAVTHLDVVLMHSDLTAPNCNFVIGAAMHNYACVTSLARFSHMRGGVRDECFKTALMHEVGHLFGLVPRTRLHAAEEKLGWHCTNRCIMRQGMTVAEWERLTHDRLHHLPVLCRDCQQTLRHIHCEAA